MNRAYADMERFFGFVADPAKVGMARHKGKVERAVPIVRKHLLAGRRFHDITDANERALHWCREEIGMEIHGTTKKKPYSAFLAGEKPHLMPLPSTPFERPLWKECTVHPDRHIVFDKSYYSVPTRYIGKKVWAQGTCKVTEIFLDQERIKVHPRSHTPGRWMTDQSDYPPEKPAFLMSTPTWCTKKAAEFGPHAEALITTILKENATRNLSKAQAILRLAEKYANDIERVAERAIGFGVTRHRSIKVMLEQGISEARQRPAPAPLSEMGQRFLRPAAYFAREVRHD